MTDQEFGAWLVLALMVVTLIIGIGLAVFVWRAALGSGF